MVGQMTGTFKITNTLNTRNGAAYIRVEDIHTGEVYDIPWRGFRQFLVGKTFSVTLDPSGHDWKFTRMDL